MLLAFLPIFYALLCKVQKFELPWRGLKGEGEGRLELKGVCKGFNILNLVQNYIYYIINSIICLD